MNVKVDPQWPDLPGVENWRPILKKLIKAASKAAEDDDFQERLDAAAYLNGFIQQSFPQTAEMDHLDDLAAQTATDLMDQDINKRLAAISSRTADYLKLEKTLNTAAEDANAAADSIRLKGIQALIDSATQTIESAKAVVDSLDDSDADDKKVAGLIERTVDAVGKLRSAVASLI